MKKIAHIFICILTCLSASVFLVKAQNPKTYTVQHGDTYYSIARALKIEPSKLIQANKSKALFAGDTLEIPSVSLKENEFITHTVKSKETLFKIAKSYNTTIQAIKDINNIHDNNIKVGQILKIKYSSTSNNNLQNINNKDIVKLDSSPSSKDSTDGDIDNINIQRSITTIKTDTNTVKVENISNQSPVETNNIARISEVDKPNDSSQNPKKLANTPTLNNPYKSQNNNTIPPKGIVQQQGIGTWLSDSDLNFSKSVALHNQAPIGTIVKVTNPMNRRSIYAKIIGKFAENDNNKGAIIIISQSAATLLGVLDNKFRINLEYASN